MTFLSKLKNAIMELNDNEEKSIDVILGYSVDELEKILNKCQDNYHKAKTLNEYYKMCLKDVNTDSDILLTIAVMEFVRGAYRGYNAKIEETQPIIYVLPANREDLEKLLRGG